MPLQEFFGSILTTVVERLGGFPFPPGVIRWAVPKIIGEFRRVSAISPRSAQRYHAWTVAEESTFVWLVKLEIIRQVSPGRYYLDEETLAARNARFFE